MGLCQFLEPQQVTAPLLYLLQLTLILPLLSAGNVTLTWFFSAAEVWKVVDPAAQLAPAVPHLEPETPPLLVLSAPSPGSCAVFLEQAQRQGLIKRSEGS